MGTYKLTDPVPEDAFRFLPRDPPPTNFEKVQEFHEAMGTKRNIWPPNWSLLQLREDLIWEEFQELREEFYPASTPTDGKNKKEIAKELSDILYVVYGAADTFGIDIDRVFEEVHRSNMSKLVDGKPLKREDGKVLKGPNYTPPNLEFLDD